MEMPSQEEQIIAEEYVLERPLDRPDTDIKKAVKSVVVYLLSSLAMGFSMLYLFSWLGIFALFSDCICDFREQHSIWFSILFILLVYFIVGLFCLKKAVIGCIMHPNKSEGAAFSNRLVQNTQYWRFRNMV